VLAVGYLHDFSAFDLRFFRFRGRSWNVHENIHRSILIKSSAGGSIARRSHRSASWLCLGWGARLVGLKNQLRPMEATMTLQKRLLILITGALFVAAFNLIGVSSAAASTTEECKIPEAGEVFTSQHFEDSNCEKPNTGGEFHTVLVKPTALLTRTNTGIVILRSVILGVNIEIKCEKYGGSKTVSNVEEKEVKGFKGEGKMIYSGCTMPEPAGCKVSESFETVTLSESSEDLKEEVMRTLFAPKEGTKLATIKITGCALEGSYPISGKLRSQTANIHTEEFTKTSGSEATIGGNPIEIIFPFHDATAANGKTVVRETP
jgi:hypothetical protein